MQLSNRRASQSYEFKYFDLVFAVECWIWMKRLVSRLISLCVVAKQPLTLFWMKYWQFCYWYTQNSRIACFHTNCDDVQEVLFNGSEWNMNERCVPNTAFVSMVKSSNNPRVSMRDEAAMKQKWSAIELPWSLRCEDDLMIFTFVFNEPLRYLCFVFLIEFQWKDVF